MSKIGGDKKSLIAALKNASKMLKKKSKHDYQQLTTQSPNLVLNRDHPLMTRQRNIVLPKKKWGIFGRGSTRKRRRRRRTRKKSGCKKRCCTKSKKKKRSRKRKSSKRKSPRRRKKRRVNMKKNQRGGNFKGIMRSMGLGDVSVGGSGLMNTIKGGYQTYIGGNDTPSSASPINQKLTGNISSSMTPDVPSEMIKASNKLQ
ncbi:MAG: hypothetical protein CML42_07560 [Rhodobacteraceae bacterium]|nr:hypothetical protein [Paracoccaceae bacterium]|tara:strand:+ start:310 stop:912 length:603 start_codon:yes stop_codon:yes gene_type:complete